MLTRFKDYLVALYLREPARSNALIAAAVMAAAGAVGVVVSAPVVLGVIAVLAPFVVAELTRPKVTPDVKLPEIESRAFELGFNAAVGALEMKEAGAKAAPPPDSLGP